MEENETDFVKNRAETSNGESVDSSEENYYEISDLALKTWKVDAKDHPSQVTEEKQITLSWCHLNVYGSRSSYSTKDVLSLGRKSVTEEKSRILKNVSGSAQPGEFLVIMGSSGAGKTTLLNCLTYRNLNGLDVSGLICMNNKPVSQPEVAANSAYVQQDDLFIGYLTVKEQLLFQSMLRMESKYTTEQRKAKVEEVMKELALKKCENCQIGVPGVVKGISGGERKRLALAGEFLTNPSILICDEPTTGLDSFMSLNVVQLLRDIAKNGRTVIATLHQPSSELFGCFDKLCLMAEGRTAFLGSTNEASSFFARLHAPCPPHFNPADHYIQILSVIPGYEISCKNAIENICDAFDASELGESIQEKAKQVVKEAGQIDSTWEHKRGRINPYRVGWCSQFWALLWRTWLSIMKNPAATRRRFIIVTIETLLITMIYFGQKYNQNGITNIDGVFVFLLVSISFQNVFAIANIMCVEIPLFIKEHKDGMYRTDVYYLTKIICAIPISIILACLSTSMCYYAVGLNPEFDRYLTTVCLSILVCLAAQGLGFIISVASPSFQYAPPIVGTTVPPLLMLGGVYLNFKSIPAYLQWLSDLSWFKYGFEAYLINQWSNVAHIECHYNQSTNSICITNGVEVLHQQSISLGDFWPAITCLIILAILFRIVGFFVLLFKVSADK